jgi:hypothetical protein
MELERNIPDTESVYSDVINPIGPLDYCTIATSIESQFYTKEETDTMVQELKNEIKDLKDSLITEEDKRRKVGIESFFDLHADDDTEETDDVPVLTTESTEDIDDEDLDSDDLTIDDLKDIEFSEKDFGLDPDSFIDPED